MATMMPVDITLTISQNGNGSYDSTWSTSAYVDAHGNMDFRKVSNPASITIRVNSKTLHLSFDDAADQAVLMAAGDPDPKNCPTTPAAQLPSSAPFQGFSHPGNDPAVVHFTNNNNDGGHWSYALDVIKTNSDGSTEIITIDPGIINH